MQAIDQYESGEMPTDNHVLAIDNFQLTYYAPQIAELTHAGNEMVVMTKANFDMVKNLGERALEKAKNDRSEEHTSELQSLMRISYAVFCLKKKNRTQNNIHDKI